jgi:hypothetical protein
MKPLFNSCCWPYLFLASLVLPPLTRRNPTEPSTGTLASTKSRCMDGQDDWHDITRAKSVAGSS